MVNQQEMDESKLFTKKHTPFEVQTACENHSPKHTKYSGCVWVQPSKCKWKNDIQGCFDKIKKQMCEVINTKKCFDGNYMIKSTSCSFSSFFLDSSEFTETRIKEMVTRNDGGPRYVNLDPHDKRRCCHEDMSIQISLHGKLSIASEQCTRGRLQINGGYKCSGQLTCLTGIDAVTYWIQHGITQNYDDNGEKQDDYLKLYPKDKNTYFDPKNDIPIRKTNEEAQKYRRIKLSTMTSQEVKEKFPDWKCDPDQNRLDDNDEFKDELFEDYPPFTTIADKIRIENQLVVNKLNANGDMVNRTKEMWTSVIWQGGSKSVKCDWDLWPISGCDVVLEPTQEKGFYDCIVETGMTDGYCGVNIPIFGKKC